MGVGQKRRLASQHARLVAELSPSDRDSVFS